MANTKFYIVASSDGKQHSTHPAGNFSASAYASTIAASVVSGNIVLTISDATGGIGSHTIEQSATGSGGWSTLTTMSAGSLINTITAPAAGTYYFRVYATVYGMQYAASSSASATIAASVVAPTLGTPSMTSDGANIPFSGGSGYAALTPQYSSNGGTTWTSIANDTTSPLTFAGLAAGSYSFRALADGSTASNVVTGTVSSGGSVAWQLTSGRYETRISDIVIMHPRPDSETNSYAQHRNAHPGIAWSTHIVGAFGAWPYHFELADGPSGMTLGQDLIAGAAGLEPGANYGLLEWPNPTTGTHSVTVNVYDQDYARGGSPSAVASVTFSLVVGTSRFVFIDPVNGSDSNAGTLAAPFATTNKLHSGSSSTSTYNGKNVYLRSGNHSVSGMSTDSGRYQIVSGGAPTVFIGYPGETATMNFSAGGVGMEGGAADLMFKDLTVQMTASWGNDQRFFSSYAHSNRHSWHNVTFKNYRIGTGTSGNNPAAIMYFSGGGGASTDCNYVTVHRCTHTGTCGSLLTLYNTRYVSYQLNTISGANFTSMTESSNAWDMIYIKDSTRDVCVRANACYSGNNYGDIIGFVGAGGQNGGAASYAYNNLQYSYNKLGGGIYRGMYGSYEYGGTPGSVYSFRNSIDSIVSDRSGYAAQPTANEWTRNAVTGGFSTMTPSFVGTQNLTGAGLFDSSMNLVAAQAANRGIRGAEIYAS